MKHWLIRCSVGFVTNRVNLRKIGNNKSMYPKLILSLDGSVVSEISLDKEAITIGRKEKNNIQIDNLAVSGVHAKVLTFGKDCFLEDLGSTNGTYVNGEAVTKCVLKHGDKIAIGKHELVYENEFAKGDESNEEDFEKTMILRPYAQGLGGEPISPKPPQPVPIDRKSVV